MLFLYGFVVFPTPGEVRNVIDLPVNEQEGIVIIVGPSQGVKIVRKIVQDCIVHNVRASCTLGNNFQEGFRASGGFAFMNCDS